jgi:hypothetical protein
MRILDILLKAGLNADRITKFLDAAKSRAPDLADEADGIQADLDAAVSPDNLTSLATDILVEVKNIRDGNIDGRKHRSDAI